MIYLDNAASTPADEEVVREMLPYFTEKYGNAQAQHSAGRKAANALLAARDKIAAIAGCNSDEIYFVSCGTEADNTAIKGVCAQFKKGHIVVSGIEHPALYDSALELQKFGFEVTFVKPDERGVITAQAVERALRPDTVFCTVMAANNETGVLQPVEEISKVCRDRGVFFYIDCVQTAGAMRLPVEYCDGLGFSAHKFYGPKGAGALYLRRGSAISRLISGGMQERGMRAGTVNVPAAVGFAAAFSRAAENREENNRYIKYLRDKFVNKVLTEIDGTHLNGDLENMIPSHANISFDGCTGENILFALDMKGIAVSTGSACSAGVVKLSRVIDLSWGESRALSAVRFSFGKHNTEEEVEIVVNELKTAVTSLRKN